jgi:hypothetical protein
VRFYFLKSFDWCIFGLVFGALSGFVQFFIFFKELLFAVFLGLSFLP